jgi:putative DNA methylase
VAVLINKAMIEIPPKFAGLPPVNPESRRNQAISSWKGAQGLAEDVCYYGQWMRNEAEKRIGHMYPKVEVTSEIAKDRPDLKRYAGQDLTVIAWLWVRTVKSPNPAFSHVDVPLASTFMLSTKAGKEAYVEPVIDGDRYFFLAKSGKPTNPELVNNGTKQGRGNFKCLLSGAPISAEYIRSEATASRLNARLLAIVAQGERGKVYLSPNGIHETAALTAEHEWAPDVEFFKKALGFRVGNYGISKWAELFTQRQLLALSTFSSLINEAAGIIDKDWKGAHANLRNLDPAEDSKRLAEYLNAIRLYLSFSLDRFADYWTSFGRWQNANQQLSNMFGRQAIPMVWDYPEANPFSHSGGSFDNLFDWTIQSIPNIGLWGQGFSEQADAGSQSISAMKVVSTDPPYYDNIGYADLSDFFYVWLRRNLRSAYPEVFGTLVTPKDSELVATPDRHGGRQGAENFFLRGMTKAMERLAKQANPAYPITIYYAFKQSESSGATGTASTGWQTFLDATISAGLAITGTWPTNTEMTQRMRGIGANALATSMVLVCERRAPTASAISRNEFRRELRQQLPLAIIELERANIAPVDVAQAAIGPGMAIYSQATSVLNPDDSPMSVRDALIEINTALDEYLSQDEGDLDADSRFALTFFESYGYEERPYGDAEGLAIARNLSVDGVADAGIISSVAGKVRLFQRAQLPDDWDPISDKRLCVWEATQHLIKRLEVSGENAAAELLLQLKNVSGHGDLAANCRALAYRLYNHCEKKKQAEEARSYNGLVVAWPELERLASASSTNSSAPRQTTLI